MQTRRLCDQQIALGGYRLADLLTQIASKIKALPPPFPTPLPSTKPHTTNPWRLNHAGMVNALVFGVSLFAEFSFLSQLLLVIASVMGCVGVVSLVAIRIKRHSQNDYLELP